MHIYSTMPAQGLTLWEKALYMSMLHFQTELWNIIFVFIKRQICVLLTNDLISWSSSILRVVVTDTIGGIAKHCNVSTVVY